MAKRLVVFMDWQNIYKRARSCFYMADDPDFTHGQVWPHKLSALLAQRVQENGDEDVTVAQTRVYRGAPRNDEDPTGYNAFQRQVTAWRACNNLVEVSKRDLIYPKSRNKYGEWVRNDLPVKEKGVDVQLAVDLVALSVEGSFDHAVVFSSDMDLAPALEFVTKRHHEDKQRPSVSVAAWDGGSRLKTTTGRRVMCHWIKEEGFRSLEDSRDYTLPTTMGHHPTPGPL